VAIVSKLDAAHSQLITAINLYFDDQDIASIHTLACAAREIYEKHCKAKGVARMFDMIEASNPDRNSKQLWEILNGARNFLKHPELSMDLDAKLEIDDEMNATMMFVASHDCATLCEANQPPETQAYNLWFIATRFPREGEATHSDPADELRYSEIIATIDQAYPGLRDAPLSEQKEVGKKMILDAKNLTPIGSGYYG
jgi:hypothetical protein